jgi:hypothetical protein
MIGFFLALGMSHLSSLYFGGASKAWQDFLPIIIGYFLVANSITSARKLNIFLSVLVLCTAFLAVEGIVEAKRGVSFFGVEPTLQHAGHGTDGEELTVTRIKWVGTFADPNDLAMTFVIVVPLLLDRFLRKRQAVTIGLLALTCYGVILTNSRGGMLSLLAALFSYLMLRYRNVKGLVVGAGLALVLLVLGPSRMGQLSSSEESAYNRLDSWYAGYQMFKSAPFFGVGKGRYLDFHDLTAHNSFVLVFAELGLFGTLFFVGLFYFPVTSCLKTVFGSPPETKDEELFHTYCAIWGGLAGLMVSMLFLSRSYVLLPYMMVALSVSFINVAGAEKGFVNVFSDGENCNFTKIALIAGSGILLFNIVIKVLL